MDRSYADRRVWLSGKGVKPESGAQAAECFGTGRGHRRSSSSLQWGWSRVPPIPVFSSDFRPYVFFNNFRTIGNRATNLRPQCFSRWEELSDTHFLPKNVNFKNLISRSIWGQTHKLGHSNVVHIAHHSIRGHETNTSVPISFVYHICFKVMGRRVIWSKIDLTWGHKNQKFKICIL